jgi:hypothetical protein
MAGFLLTFVTEALQKSPERVFEGTDLSDRAEPGEIEDLVRKKILVPRVGGEPSGGDGVSYTVDLGVIAKTISKAKTLKSPEGPVRLDPRLVFLGTSAMKGEKYAWFLALAEEDEEIAALLERKGGAYVEADRLAVVTAKEPVRAMTKQSGLRRKLDFVTLGELGLTDVRNEAVRRKRLAAPSAGADAALEEEIAAFPSRSRIDIPGEWAAGHYSREERRASGATLNAFKVNGETKNVGDALFLFLLRLIVGLFEEKENGGYVRNSDFDVYGDMHLSARELDGQVSRLRQHLRGSVEDVRQFIDRTKRGYTRLGVHPSLITFNRTKLIAHPNKPIRKLAERLPVLPEANS